MDRDYETDLIAKSKLRSVIESSFSSWREYIDAHLRLADEWFEQYYEDEWRVTIDRESCPGFYIITRLVSEEPTTEIYPENHVLMCLQVAHRLLKHEDDEQFGEDCEPVIDWFMGFLDSPHNNEKPEGLC